MDTNFFGALSVTKAALPHLRAQKRGAIVNVSSAGGQHLAACPLIQRQNRLSDSKVWSSQRRRRLQAPPSAINVLIPHHLAPIGWP
jgi:NAD(P)-dependent dehydrogenase (short-subunit alcohol dehydrogenase family)